MKGLKLNQLLQMAHSPLHNYIVPGLTSSLIGAHSADGVARIFVNSRTQFEHVTPHSHRFDFQCLVLRGEVVNILFEEGGDDRYLASSMRYLGTPGQFERNKVSLLSWHARRCTYRVGDWYGMTRDQVHSIIFSDDAVVLFLEGPQVTDTTIILEPWVDGEVLPTFKTEPWMFRKGEVKS